MEVLANKIAEGLSVHLGIDRDRQAVITYGLIGLLQITTLFIVITIIGAITDSLYECLIILLSVGIIRKSTGGAHSSTMNACNTISILSITIMALLSRYILNRPIENYVNFGITFGVFIIGYIIFHYHVPVDSPNKPIVNPEKIRRLRKESFVKLIVFFLLTIGVIVLADRNVRYYGIASSIRIALIWQAMTLTGIGISLVARLDSIVNRMLEKMN